MKNIAIVGSSGHAKVIVDTIEKEKKFNILGLLDPNMKVGKTILGYDVLGSEDSIGDLCTQSNLFGVFVAIGDNFRRHQLSEKIKSQFPNITFVSTIHPSSHLAKGVEVGQGTAILSGARVGPSCRIGDFCLLNVMSSLDHDSQLENFASLAPGAITGGNCTIGEFSAIGLGAKLIHGITVGEHTVVGAGSTATKDIAPFVTAYGTPAKTVRSRKEGDAYL